MACDWEARSRGIERHREKESKRERENYDDVEWQTWIAQRGCTEGTASKESKRKTIKVKERGRKQEEIRV